MVPVWQPSAEAQAAPDVHATQAPLRHCPREQVVPSGWLASWEQTGFPVEHSIFPALQPSCETQSVPSAHPPHFPCWQAPPGQPVPSGWSARLVQTGWPEEQSRVPALQPSVEVQAAPVAHETQLPAWHTPPVHLVPSERLE